MRAIAEELGDRLRPAAASRTSPTPRTPSGAASSRPRSRRRPRPGCRPSSTEETDLPFEVAAAIRLDDQAEFDPVKYLLGARRRRSTPTSRASSSSTRATGVGRRARARPSAGTRSSAERVIVATQLPFLDRGLFFARAHRAALVCAQRRGSPAPVPQGMYLQRREPDPVAARSALEGRGAADRRRRRRTSSGSGDAGRERSRRSRRSRARSFDVAGLRAPLVGARLHARGRPAVRRPRCCRSRTGC